MGIYTLDTDFSSLHGPQTSEWLLEFGEMVGEAFVDKDDRCRLLGNQLIMELYVNTLRQGLAENGEKLSAALQQAQCLLWDYLKGCITPADFQEFANDLYACLIAYNVGDIHTDAPEEFYKTYFADTNPNSYELAAIEWSAGLLLELVAITGGQLEFDEFETCERIDFYGIEIMLNLLEEACLALTNTPLHSHTAKAWTAALEQVHITPLFQQITHHIRHSLKIACTAMPEQYALLWEEYQQYTILPEEYAGRLLEY